ncbi:MAG: sodium:solute symporter family protein [Candidatus Eremiobacteraeota bacterium]|nr:sodium:solute symporter family protein [Candidatus Eremiobacteraeota bacterium]
MVNAVSSLGIVFTVVVGTILFALFSLRRIAMSPQEYIVGGRGFGAVFLWVLLAGEIYTSFTFLGAAGWTYGFGAPAFYIMAYGTVGYIFGYFLLPRIWQIGKERGLLTAPDFFSARYGNKPLATFAALVYAVSILPYVTLQLSGLQIFLTYAGYGRVDAQLGAIISFVAIVLFVFATGLRGTAWASIIKDALVIGALLFVGLAIPIQFFGSPVTMFDQMMRAHPSALVLGSATAPKGTIWYVSTVLLTGIGFFMGPHSVAAAYSAKDASVLRRNAMLLPVYQLIMLLVFFAGFSALLIAPGLTGTAVDQSFLVVVQRFYPSWVLGFVCAAGALCSLIPSTALLLSAASILAKNIAGDLFSIALSDRNRVILTRTLVAALGLGALVLWIALKTTLVSMLLLYYNGITQFAPAFFLGFFWRRTTTAGVATGLIAGITLAVFLASRSIAPFGINPGFIALTLNVTLAITISLLTKTKEPAI